ncbi:MAG: hypothetical protein QOD39_1926, partial [Mycobacterium sp.]|nr:hypothetical protein [Mycobacterium sp.]
VAMEATAAPSAKRLTAAMFTTVLFVWFAVIR